MFGIESLSQTALMAVCFIFEAIRILYDRSYATYRQYIIDLPEF